MDGLALLREYAANASAVSRSTKFEPRILRFVLEYREAPDIAVERQAIEGLMGAGKVDISTLFEAADADLSRFLLLTIPGTERPPIAAPLFAMAHVLAEARGLVSCEPDVGAEVFADPEPDIIERRPESADALGRLCWVDVDEVHVPGYLWALDNIRVREAWALAADKGTGIVVAQPDTGIAAHDEIAPGNLRLDLATDILEGDADPTDPLDPTTANPGHGTATASVVVSREDGRIAGSAPSATLVPIRCIEDVKVFDGAPVAAAIDHARRKTCHIVTMSLGGVPSRSMQKAIEKAIAEHMIVLAAAGNCVGVVVWPARYDQVIAVAGTNAADRPWKGSSRGADVDVSAPAELVWRARREGGDETFDRVTPGQGTSFSVALTAGVAALWLAHHGRDTIIATASARGTTVQELFRSALRKTARVPANWDRDSMGTGIVDARALLELPLDRIPAARPERTPGSPGPNRLLSEVMGDEPPPPSPPGAGAFDWAAHGLEVAHLLLSDARAGRFLAGPRWEARSREAASDGLVAAAGASADPHLRALVARGPRAIMPVVQTPPAVLERGFTILARPRTSGFESAAPLTLETARVRLATEGVRTRLDVAEKVFRHRAGSEGNSVDTALQNEVLSVGERVLTRFTQTGAPPPAFGIERVAFEALVSLTGRPALRVENGFLNLDAPELENWRTAIEMGKPEIEKVLPSVGRIDMNGEHIGTGFIVTSGLIMTNRHVLEAIAAPIPTRLSPKRWTLLSDNTVIDFSPNPDVEQSSFRIKSVVFAGPDPIDDVVDFAHLDLALLEVETTNATGETLPPALSLSKSDKRALRSRNLYVVGYPAQPVVPLGSVNGTDRATIVEKLRQIFGLRYGRKYFSPGQVSIASGGDPQDAKGWVFAHDATTLGGNSGSCVLHFGDPMAVVGLHFAGDWMRANFAHAMAALQGVLGSAVPGDTPTTWI